MDEHEIRNVIDDVKAGRLSRRSFVGTMVALGLTTQELPTAAMRANFITPLVAPPGAFLREIRTCLMAVHL